MFEANCVRGELCSPTIQGYHGNPHLFTQGSKAGERSSPLRCFPHQPKTRFRGKACRNLAQAAGSRLFFYYEAKRVTKQSPPPPHRSQRYVSLTQAVNYRLFFYYEAQRVTKQSLPSPHRSQRHVSLTQVVNYRLFFYYEAQRVTNWFIQILFGARCGCIDSAARLF